MNEFRTNFNSYLIVLALSILLSACGGGGGSSSSSNVAASNSSTIETIAPVATVMVSTSSNLSNPTPLSGAALNGGVYIFFQEGTDWETRGISKVVFYCCKSNTSPHTVFPADTVAPYMVNVDLSPFAAGSTRELYADVFFKDAYIPEPFLVNFTINGTSAGNNPPTINGNPSITVIENKNYSFTPTAADSDGDTLTFSIANKPIWASFNTSTGALTGTPTTNDIGTDSNIRISVSDGVESSLLTPFDISVSVQTSGNATLSWTPPTENDDGSTLTDLAGYKIHYGTTPGSYTTIIDVSPGLTEYVINNLDAPNSYYFVMTTYNSLGTGSYFSNEVSKDLQ